MAIFKRPRIWEADIEVVGARAHPGRDLYHLLLWLPWWVDLLILTTLFVIANLIFAAAYHAVGGVAGARGYVDEFYFSVETMGTIGYGEMYPITRAAHAIVTMEALVQIFLIAVTTGLVFAKFSIPRARVQFADKPVIAPHDGTPTLQFRIGNERSSALLEAVIRIVMFRTEKTREGMTLYRMYDLKLERERSPALSRSWTVLHRLDAGPLDGATPEILERDEVEFMLTLSGTDELSAQMLHAQRRYLAKEIAWGQRHKDMLSELTDGRLRMDMAHFHELIPTRRTADFPYGE
jgi:inward rectifier potassium channel